MKLAYLRALAPLLCGCFISICGLGALEDLREPLTSVEENKIEEGRLSQYPEELLQDMGNFSGSEDFQDFQYLHLVHPNADHYLIGCSDCGDVIQFNDESEWSIGLFSRGVVLGWKSDDVIYVKPKYSWFSYYSYSIQNRTTNESADANILSVPLFPVPNTVEIIGIDPTLRVVQLSDDTLWQINQSDYSFRKWRVGDRLIVGVNNYWRMGVFVHILINTTYHNKPYCEANFIGYPPGS